MVLLVPLSNLLHLFPYATVTRCGPSSSSGCFLLSLDNRVNTFIQTQRKRSRCRFKVLLVLTHAGRFAVTHVSLHVLLTWKWYPHTLVCSLQEWALVWFIWFQPLKFFFFFSKDFFFFLWRVRHSRDARGKQSADFYIRVAISFVLCSLQAMRDEN